MTALIRTARDLKATAPGVAALILAGAVSVALVGLVFKDVPRDHLAEWGIVLGLFLQQVGNLLTQARGAGRATDASTRGAG